MNFSMWHVIVIVSVGLAIWGAIALSRWSRRAEKPGGVGGWLALLIAGLIFLGPLFSAGRISSDFMDTESKYPKLLTVEAWLNYKNTAWIFFGIATLFGIYAGWCLARRRISTSPFIAIAAIWILGPLLSVILAIILPIIFFGATGLDAAGAGALAVSGLPAVAWTLYLLKSKRVKALYHQV
ncbi:DUF2569 family protein [Polaromonas sp. JS666]|uniref:DUF2569 family protein n=1 Tax=Polaromonas sp. (strain JS666 / ATCC BAA-500) TaxID=296591 RepID=UPI0009D669BF|nr:DUF2569 family protein [Polaromonas sp. JS666]